MDLPLDFKELLEAFDSAEVDALVVGGYAVAFHGRPRATKDIDILLGGDEANLARAARALDGFGAPANVVRAVAEMGPTEVVFMGQPPLRIDFLRTIDGVESSALFERAVKGVLDGIAVRFISLDDLIANKRAAGRPLDLIDATFLERVSAERAGST